MDKPENQSCGTCRYAERAPINPKNVGADRQLVCKRFPPTASRVITGQLPDGQLNVNMSSFFPMVNDDTHCWEWAPEPGEDS